MKLAALVFNFTRSSKRSTQKGLSIIELMIVISITALVLTMAVANMSSFQKKNNFKINQLQFMADLRLAQTWAKATRQGTIIDSNPYNNRLIGYGVHLEAESNQYIIWEVWQDEEGLVSSFEETPQKRLYIHEFSHSTQIVSVYPAHQDIIFRAPFGKLDFTESLDEGAFDTDGKIRIVLQTGSQRGEVLISRNATIEKGKSL